jgi:nitrite reductase/ring-hydroxylating ferredoxin subunit
VTKAAAPPPADRPQPRRADDPRPLCASDALAERGRAFVWDLLHRGQPARAFALRFDGRVVAYLNRCAHVPTEMDWQEGEFLDMDRRWILCSIHGASYEPADGRCVGGPCGRGRLTPIGVGERGGQVYWYPSHDTRPVFDEPAVPAADTAPPAAAPPEAP